MYTTEEIKKLIANGREHDFYNDRYWRRLSHSVIKDNHFECEICRRRGRARRAVITHHVQHLKNFPELAYHRGNLIPVCRECHETLHPEEWHSKAKKRFKNDEKW